MRRMCISPPATSSCNAVPITHGRIVQKNPALSLSFSLTENSIPSSKQRSKMLTRPNRQGVNARRDGASARGTLLPVIERVATCLDPRPSPRVFNALRILEIELRRFRRLADVKHAAGAGLVGIACFDRVQNVRHLLQTFLAAADAGHRGGAEQGDAGVEAFE